MPQNNPFADLIPQSGAAPGYIPGRPKAPTTLELQREDRAARSEVRADAASERAAAAAERQAKLDEKKLTVEGRLTEAEGKTTAFYNRALGADRDYEASGVATEPRGILGQMAVDVLPTAVTNNFTSPERQKAEQAKRDFIAASLRYESGAAIGQGEFDKQDQTFFPQVGDGPEVIAQKRAARQRVIESFKISSGVGSGKVDALRSADAPATPTELRFKDEQAAPPTTAYRFSPDQEAQIRKTAATGSKEALDALVRGYGKEPLVNSQAIADFYRDPKNRDVPLGETDYSRVDSVTPIDIGDGAGGAMAREGVNSATLGVLGPRGLAAIRTIADGGTYNENLDHFRGIQAYDQQNNPVSALAGGLVGGAVNPLTRYGAGGGVARAAGVGALEAGSYAGLNSYGSAGDRLLATGAGAAVGAGLAASGSALASRLMRPGGPPVGPTDGQLVGQAAARQGVDVLPADVGGPMTRRFTSGAAQGPLSAGPIIRGAQRVSEQFQGARGRIANEVGNPVSAVEAGERAQTGAQGYINSSRAQVGGLYDAARTAAGDGRTVAQRAINVLDDNLRELGETPQTSAPVTNALERLGGDLSSPDGLSIDGLRRLRTNVRGLAQTDELRGTDFQRRAGQVLDAISDDIADGLSPEARNAFRAADRAHRERIETIDEVLKPIVGGRGEKAFPPERVYQNIMTATRTNSGRLRRFVDALPADDQASLRATVIDQLGNASAGTQNAEGNAFSINQFLTHWNQLTPRAKDTLFRGDTRAALNDLATIADGSKAASQYANRSNTGGAVNIAGLLGIGAYSPAAAATAGGAQYLTGRLLASPRFARWLARPASNPQTAIRRLTTIGSREPIIANDVAALSGYLEEALAQSPGRAAAQDERNGRPKPVQ